MSACERLLPADDLCLTGRVGQCQIEPVVTELRAEAAPLCLIPTAMTGRPKPEPSGRVEPSLAFQLPWRNVSAYPPERLEDVEKTILQCRVGLFHLERSIAFVSGEVLDEMHHGLVGRGIPDTVCRSDVTYGPS
jgi:hypothetical protein